MAYQGSTAGSTVANPPHLVAQLLSGSTNTGATNLAGNHLWVYRSTHLNSAADADGFFTDGEDLGMELGDIVFVLGSTTYALSVHTVRAVSSTGVSISVANIVSSAS